MERAKVHCNSDEIKELVSTGIVHSLRFLSFTYKDKNDSAKQQLYFSNIETTSTAVSDVISSTCTSKPTLSQIQEKDKESSKVIEGNRVSNLITRAKLGVVIKIIGLSDNDNKLLVWTVVWDNRDKSSKYNEQEIKRARSIYQ